MKTKVEEYFEEFTGGNYTAETWKPKVIMGFATDYHRWMSLHSYELIKDEITVSKLSGEIKRLIFKFNELQDCAITEVVVTSEIINKSIAGGGIPVYSVKIEIDEK